MEGQHGEGSLHVGVGHPALKEVLEAGHAFEGLAGDVQHRRITEQQTTAK